MQRRDFIKQAGGTSLALGAGTASIRTARADTTYE